MTLVSHSPARAAAAEAFAGDLLRLIRTTRTFPNGHPSLAGVAARVLASARALGPVPEIGIAATELVLGREFLGSPGSLAGTLASTLHERRVALLRWGNPDTADLLAFARTLALSPLSGAPLRQGLRDGGVTGIDVVPLELEELHAAAVPGVVRPAGEDAGVSRRLDAWLWLQHRDASPERLAGLLTTDEFWREAGAEPGAPEGARAFARFLADLGERLEQAVRMLSEEQRGRVAERLAGAGAALALPDLVEILGQGDPEGPRGLAIAALLRDLSGERVVDLMAGLAAAAGGGTRRLAAVFRRFAPPGGAAEVLEVVRARLSGPADGEIAAEVWRTVEECILQLQEEPFMPGEYSESLEALSQASPPVEAGLEDGTLDEDPERHLDGVFLGAASDGGSPWRERLLGRLSERAAALGPWKGVALASLADELLPGVVDLRPSFVRELFRAALLEARDASTAETKAFVAFCARHEALLLDTALKGLAEEQRLASRRLIVEVLSCFSSACTPAMVSRARTGPWFVARNLAIVLGRQGGGRALPVLQELCGHPHPKVRREAQRALAGVRP